MRVKKDPHFVYLLKEGEMVVYVGCTKNLHSRMKAHKKKQHNNVEVIKFKYKMDALNHERHLLVVHMPKYNCIFKHIHENRTEYLKYHYPLTP